MPPYDERVSGKDVCPLRRGVASSEAEMSYLLEGGSLPSSEAEKSYPLEGRSATLERGGDRPAGPREVRMGRMLGFFESFPFFRIGRRPWGFVGPVALTCACVF